MAGTASRPSEAAAGTSGVAVMPPGSVVSVSARRSIVPWAIATALIAAAAAGATYVLRAPAAAPAATRLLLEIGPPSDHEFIVGSNAGAVVISPDGSTVAFIVQTPAGRKLYVRTLATGETRQLSGTADVHYPFWSADSQSLGFFGSRKLFTVAIAGGLPEAVADIDQGRGGSWSDSGVILFTPVGGGVIHRVAERGGAVAQVTTLDASRGENAHYWPVALPGGTKFLFFVRSTRPENNGIYLGSLDGTTKPVRLVTSLSSGLYAPPRDGAPGSLLWVRDAELLAQPLDIEGARLTGDVTTIATDVRVEESQRGTFASVSSNGTIVWASADAGEFAFAWYDRSGKRLAALPIAPGKLMQPRLSLDGRKLVFTRAAAGTADIWVHDLSSGATSQLTTDPDYDENPELSPDGRLMVYGGTLPRRDRGLGPAARRIEGAGVARP